MDEKYLHNVARTLAGQHGIHEDHWSHTSYWPASIPKELVLEFQAPVKWEPAKLRRPLARALLHRYWDSVSHKISTFSAERRGLLCQCAPNPSRYADHTRIIDVCNETFSPEWAGGFLLTKIATLAVFAAMTDNLLAEMIKKYGDNERLYKTAADIYD